MRPFEYLEPANLREACRMLSRYKDRAKVLAGGQSLLPILKQRLISPPYLVNIKCLQELEYIKEDRAGIKIGALTTHHALETSALIQEKFPMLVDMERSLGSIQIRNWGTIGGNLCHADPGTDPGPALIALKAKIKAASTRGYRTIPLDSFFRGYLETVLETDEILTEIALPYPAAGTGSSYIKESVRFGERAIASVATSVTIRGRKIKEARITLGSIAATPLRASEAEKLLYNIEIEGNLGKAIAAASEEAQPVSDLEGSREYKKQIIRVITKKALEQAILRAQEYSGGSAS